MPRLDAVVRGRFNLSWAKARLWIETGKIWSGGVRMTDPSAAVDGAAELELRMNAPKSSPSDRSVPVLPRSEVIFLDSQLIVVNKPAGVNTVPYEKEEPHALEQMVCEFLKQRSVEVVHRLDRETSGLLVFARNREAGKFLSNQFRFHTVLRRYLALAHGEVKSGTIRSALIEDRGDGLRGSVRAGRRDSTAKEAVTHVRELAVESGLTLIECRLETGRTHQIRIHLSESGHPLVGERAYVREYGGQRIPAARLMLHAAELGFVHPTKGVQLRWVQPPPPDFLGMLSAHARGAIAGLHRAKE